MNKRFSSRYAKFYPGFTLVEVLLYLALLGTILLVSASFISFLMRGRVKNHSVAEVEQQGAFVMRTILNQIKNASAITAPLAGASSAALSLNTFSSSTDPTVISLNNSRLELSEGGGPFVYLTASNTTTSNLSFHNVSQSGTPGIVRVSFTLSYNSPATNFEYVYQTNFYGSSNIRK